MRCPAPYVANVTSKAVHYTPTHRLSLDFVIKKGRTTPAVLALPLRLVEALALVELVVVLAAGAGLLGPGEGLRTLLAEGWLTLAALALALLTYCASHLSSL